MNVEREFLPCLGPLTTHLANSSYSVSGSYYLFYLILLLHLCLLFFPDLVLCIFFPFFPFCFICTSFQASFLTVSLFLSPYYPLPSIPASVCLSIHCGFFYHLSFLSFIIFPFLFIPSTFYLSLYPWSLFTYLSFYLSFFLFNSVYFLLSPSTPPFYPFNPPPQLSFLSLPPPSSPPTLLYPLLSRT